ncbi:MAG TPA: MFS transporter [Alphaproteobacteria bacterium]|jgi:MFS family permease|nr:MFS transporter [Alphaproteobacteria bacterium]
MTAASDSATRHTVPRTVWALGLVSMFMDMSSEMIHALLPVFLVGTLGASAILVGIIEGIGEGATAITKIFSGAISDWLGKRKLLTVIGYGMGAASKPFFAIAMTPFEVLAARLVDRIGKGIRGAPRDALVADVTPAHARGAAFGLRQSLDTIGAFSGPLLAMALLALFADVRMVFWIALIPGVICVLILVLFVREPESTATATKPAAAQFAWSRLRGIGRAYWTVVAIGIVFTFARFSEAFLVLRGQDAGLTLALLPGVLIAMNVVYAASAWPAGWLSDRIDRRLVLAVGLGALIVADLMLAAWNSVPGLLLGVSFWGLHMGLTQGLLAAMIADTAPADLRGTAFGLFNVVTGVMMFLASALAGVLWETVGHDATFVAGAVFAGLSATALVLLRRRAE